MPRIPFRNFLPSIGRLVNTGRRRKQRRWHHGAQRHRRTGGCEISIYYDPMIAKLVTHAPSRAAAIEAQAAALDSFYIDGIRHNIPFLSALMNHPRWRAEIFPPAHRRGIPERVCRARAGRRDRATAGSGRQRPSIMCWAKRKRQISGQMIGRPVQRERRRAVWLERNEIALEVAREGEGHRGSLCGW